MTFTIGSVGCCLSSSTAMLVCFRIVQGIGSAAMYPVGIAILTSVFPAGELGWVLGINGVCVYLGFSVGPFLGLGYALFAAPNMNAVMRSVKSRFYGVAAGTLSTMRITGMVFSTGIVLLSFSLYIGKVQITPEFYPFFLRCMKLTFAFFGILCFGGVFASFASRNVRKNVPAD